MVDVFFPDGSVERHEVERNPILHSSFGAGPHGPIDLGEEPAGNGTTTKLFDGKDGQAPTLNGAFPAPNPPPGEDVFRFAAETKNATGSGNAGGSVNLTVRVAFDPN